MGFFWDDWPLTWISQNLGTAGLAQYFSTNRPVWGLLYQLTMPIIGISPLAWQVFAILGRLVTVLACWTLVRQVWPARREIALWVSLLFAIYPGYTQFHVAVFSFHFFLVISFFLFSLVCTVAAIRRPARFRLLTGLALLLSLANLLMLEYFFMLDLLRPVLIFIALGSLGGGWREKVWRTIRLWAPYLVVFAGAAVWRAFLFPYTQENYKLLFLDQLKSQPLQALVGLVGKVLNQLWISSGEAWSQVLKLPDSTNTLAAGSKLRFLLLMGVLGVLLLVALLPKRPDESTTRWGWQVLLVGLIGMLLAGFPFWLTDVPFSLNFAYDRFTLPFMLGVSLTVVGILDLLPVWRPAKVVLLALAVTLAAGWQVEVGSTYVSDWQVQQGLFQQLTWRVPGLSAGTTIFSNELPIHPTDNSLTAPLNWIYAPGNPGGRLPYLLNWPTIRLGSETLPALAKGQPIRKDYLVSVFTGSTDQAIAVYYNPPACLRLLSDQDGNDPLLPSLTKSMAVLSKPSLVLGQGSAGPARLIPGIFPQPQAGTWCESFEEADLAVQQNDWDAFSQVAAQAGDPIKRMYSPNELYPFIEGFAHLGNWQRVAELSKTASPAANSDLKPQVCAILARVLQSTPGGPLKTSALTTLNQSLDCGLDSQISNMEVP